MLLLVDLHVKDFQQLIRWQKENEDPRNKLFFEYLRFVEVLKPKVVMIENVRGILSSNNGYDYRTAQGTGK